VNVVFLNRQIFHYSHIKRTKTQVYGILFYKQRIFTSHQLWEGEERIKINGFTESSDLLGIMSSARHRNPSLANKEDAGTVLTFTAI
jgi:hypothetical protein